jgi:hypothetical protein
MPDSIRPDPVEHPQDPLHAASQRAARLHADVQAKVHEIKDPPLDPEAPAMPELLTQPVQRPASMLPKPAGLASGMGELGKSLAIGFDFLFTAAAGGALGYLFDRWMGRFPIGTIVGALIGFVVGTVRLLKRLNAPEPKRRPSDTPPARR